MGIYNSSEEEKKSSHYQNQRPINTTQISSDSYKNQIKTTIPKTQNIQPKNNIINKPKAEINYRPNVVKNIIKTEKITPGIKPKPEIKTSNILKIDIKKPKTTDSNGIQNNQIIINNNKAENINKMNSNSNIIINESENYTNNYNNNDYYQNNDEYYPKENYDNNQVGDYYYQENEYFENEDNEDYYEDEGYYNDNYYDNYNNNENNYNNNNSQMTFNDTESFTEMIDKEINPYPIEEIDDKEINILMIAEKPSIARTISKILGRENLINRSNEKGWCYYEFDGEFKGVNAHFIISAVTGHIYQVDFPDEYQGYDIDPFTLFDAPIEKVESDENSYLNIEWLNGISKNIDILCLWLDCDREGENICYEVMHNVLPNMNKKEYQQIYRAIFSSLAENDIINSFNNISNYPDNNLSLSVDARQIIDLKVGVSISRFLTNSIRDYLPEDVRKNSISYGPCQTPTLYFCVKREREIENENNKYYKIYITLKSNYDNSEVEICLNNEFNNFQDVENLMNQISNMKKIKIENMNYETRTKSHPQGLNTATLLKISSLYLKNSPQTTMNLAQNLYMLGVITYPRTETTYYSPSFNFNDNLYYLGCDEEFINYVLENLDTINEGGIDAGDHPPITPLSLNDDINLTEKQDKLYNLIIDYYLASLSPDMEYNNVIYEFKVGNKIYKATSHVIENEGYSQYFDYELKDFNYDKNYLESNQFYDIVKVEYDEKIKDDYITEAELIEEMEKNKIGTDASMSAHIENIVKRGYVEVTEDRRLIPTDLGRALIEGLEEVEPELVLPKNRAIIEDFVSQLAEGKKTYKEVLEHAINFYKNKYNKLYDGIDTIFEAFRKYFDMGDDYYYYEN